MLRLFLLLVVAVAAQRVPSHEITRLVLHSAQRTNRSNVPQAMCLPSGDVCLGDEDMVFECTKSTHWQCTTTLPVMVNLGHTYVVCEQAGCGDVYVDSCWLAYTLRIDRRTQATLFLAVVSIVGTLGYIGLLTMVVLHHHLHVGHERAGVCGERGKHADVESNEVALLKGVEVGGRRGVLQG